MSAKANNVFLNRYFSVWVIIGIVFTLTGLLVAELAVHNVSKKAKGDMECFLDTLKKENNLSGVPVGQLNYLKKKCKQRLEEIETQKDYLKRLKTILNTPTDPGFFKVNPAMIHEQTRILKTLEKNKDCVQEATTGTSIAMFMISILWLTAFITTSYYIRRHARKTFLPGINVKNFPHIKRVYWLTVISVFFLFLMRAVFTNFFIVEKEWFTWYSFALSKSAWISLNVFYLGGVMVGAYTFAIGYCLTHKDNAPKINLGAFDTKCGVGKYLSFLEVWLIAACFIVFVPTILWVKLLVKMSKGDYSAIYLLDFAAIITLAMIIILRILLRIISIRFAYREKIEGERKTWSELQDSELPPDPTLGLLGKHWWNLPAALSGVFGGLWIFIKILGLEEILLGLFK